MTSPTPASACGRENRARAGTVCSCHCCCCQYRLLVLAGSSRSVGFHASASFFWSQGTLVPVVALLPVRCLMVQGLEVQASTVLWLLAFGAVGTGVKTWRGIRKQVMYRFPCALFPLPFRFQARPCQAFLVPPFPRPPPRKGLLPSGGIREYSHVPSALFLGWPVPWGYFSLLPSKCACARETACVVHASLLLLLRCHARVVADTGNRPVLAQCCWHSR